MRRLIRFVAFALLAWMPLQAAALPALMTACELDPAHSPMHQATHEHGSAGHGGHSHGDDGAHGHDGQSGGAASVHDCCHQYSTAAPALAVAAPDVGTTVFVAPPLRLSEFIPEQPKRPPLARL
jgi:hypothetical protein